MNNLEEEIRKLVIHTMGTEKPKTMERSYPRWNDEDLSFDMYFNPYRHTWSTALSEAYTGMVHDKLETIIIRAVKQQLKALGHED